MPGFGLDHFKRRPSMNIKNRHSALTPFVATFVKRDLFEKDMFEGDLLEKYVIKKICLHEREKEE